MQIRLDGNDWQFKEYYGEDWRWRDAHRAETRDTRFWKQGTVPGSVHHDLWALREVPDPYFERNSLLLEWIPARTWLYKKAFHVGQELAGQRIQLCFEGVDYEAEFYLNGELLGRHCSMFTPAVFEVSNLLHYGAENTLVVVLEASPHEEPQVSRTSKVTTHKSRMTYWWDFCPRMIHIGIWDSVYLNVTGPVRVDDVFVRPRLASDLQRADVSVTSALDAASDQTVQVETTLRLDGQVVASARQELTLSAGQNEVQASLTLDQPALWWPNGYGEQPLYEAEVRVLPAGETDGVSDTRVVEFGVRRVELVPNETPDTTARPYTFVVNGRKLYIKGWNWVPMDVMYGVERPTKLARLLTLARDAHVNMLRIWGGGLIEKQAFYALCDRLGIMVWQEFIQSSSGIENNAPDTPEYIDFMVGEAEQIVPRKRNHPSLVLWGGGNELSLDPNTPLDDTHPLLAALKESVARLDPDRHWLPTSPTGRVFLNAIENIERDPEGLHDVHGPWEYQGVTGQYDLSNRSTSLLHSEFGAEGITNWRTLQVTIAPENQWPATLDNPVWHHRGAWWNQHPMWLKTFGSVADIETLTRATQYMQAVGLRYAVEADRRRKYQSSGTLPWQFNEPYPNATCTSALDYYARPKPVYYAVSHAYEPLHVSARFPTVAWEGREEFVAEIWANNSHETAYAGTLIVRLVGASGRQYAAWAEAVSIQPDSARGLIAIRHPLAALPEVVFFLDAALHREDGPLLSRNRYAFTTAANLAPLLTVAQTSLDVRLQANGDTWTVEITNTGENVAMNIWLEDARDLDVASYVYLDANYLCLLPGESRPISARWQGVPAAERSLTVSAWNTEEWQLS